MNRRACSSIYIFIVEDPSSSPASSVRNTPPRQHSTDGRVVSEARQGKLQTPTISPDCLSRIGKMRCFPSQRSHRSTGSSLSVSRFTWFAYLILSVCTYVLRIVLMYAVGTWSPAVGGDDQKGMIQSAVVHRAAQVAQRSRRALSTP